MSVYLPTYCPGDPCDPCACTWTWEVPPATYFLTFVGGDPEYLCGIPYWGIGARAATVVARGTGTTGLIDVIIHGKCTYPAGSPPTGPTGIIPSININYNGVGVISLDPASGAISDFTLTHYSGWHDGSGALFVIDSWQATATISLPAIMLGSPDDILSFSGVAQNAVVPYMGPLDAGDITITYGTSVSTTFHSDPFTYTPYDGGPPWTPNPGGPQTIDLGATSSLLLHPYYVRAVP
jgi:hypothetical protein